MKCSLKISVNFSSLQIGKHLVKNPHKACAPKVCFARAYLLINTIILYSRMQTAHVTQRVISQRNINKRAQRRKNSYLANFNASTLPARTSIKFRKFLSHLGVQYASRFSVFARASRNATEKYLMNNSYARENHFPFSAF